ncbi:hypothetical protein TWF281_002838 [Arthrobotrys megalospora]
MSLPPRAYFMAEGKVSPETIALIVVTGTLHLITIGILIYIAIQLRRLKMGGKNRKQKEDLESGDPELVPRPGNQDASGEKQRRQNIPEHSHPEPDSDVPSRKSSVRGGVRTAIADLVPMSPKKAGSSTPALDQRQDPSVTTPIEESDNIKASSPGGVAGPRVGTKDGRTNIPTVTVKSTTGRTMMLV